MKFKDIRKFLTYNSDESILLLFGVVASIGIFSGHINLEVWKALAFMVFGYYFGKSKPAEK